jgi:hypothetical protein
MSRRPPLPLLLSSAALLSAAAIGALAQSNAGDGQFKGMPVTGELDAQSVLKARYGQAAEATAPVVPSAGSAGASVSATTGTMHMEAPHAATAAAPAPAAKAAPSAPAAHTEPTPRPLPARGAAGVPHGFRELGGFTGVAIDSTDGDTQREVPVTFGQVFAPGEVKAGERLAGKLAGGATVPLQVDVKARHADGSVRHAVISALLPALGAHKSVLLALAKDGKAAPDAAPNAANAKALLDEGFRSCVSATIDGQAWSACADKLLAGKQAAAWLAGPVSREWLVDAPLTNAKGAEHPHLAARFAVRWYPQAHKARVDVSVENDWAYEPDPRNIKYDARVTVAGKEVYAKPGLNHLHHARWRKVFWWGEAPAVALRYDSAYLDATRAVPHYDPSIVITGGALGELASRMSGKAIEPMGPGMATTYMPMTGAHSDIGLLPSWAAIYLLSMDPKAALATFGTGDLAGSWPIHYRDKKTGRPVSLLDHPYMTLLGHPGDTVNPATNKQEKFPDCAEHACDTDYTPDIPHQPSLAYLPYLLSGDVYYLEEMQFWATWDAFSSNPAYRDNVKGLLKPEQVRGQAWGLRTMGEAAYATPDNDRLKTYFTSIVKHNLDWYNAEYSDNPAANKLGMIVNGYAMVYNNGTGLAPWQDDFFTSSVGHLADLGFKDAGRLLAWKSRFPVARMVAPGACWVDGAIYELNVRPKDNAPLFTSMAEAYKASHPADLQALPCASPAMFAKMNLRPGSMANLPDATMGYPANMQPALAYAADAAGAPGKEAWKLFMARSVKPDYGNGPQFAIVPRAVKSDANKD